MDELTTPSSLITCRAEPNNVWLRHKRWRQVIEKCEATLHINGSHWKHLFIEDVMWALNVGDKLQFCGPKKLETRSNVVGPKSWRQVQVLWAQKVGDKFKFCGPKKLETRWHRWNLFSGGNLLSCFKIGISFQNEKSHQKHKKFNLWAAKNDSLPPLNKFQRSHLVSNFLGPQNLNLSPTFWAHKTWTCLRLLGPQI